MINPLAPKTIVLINIQRINWAVSACCSGAKPGAITHCTSGPAKVITTAAMMTNSTVINVSTRLKSNQAASRWSRAQCAAKVGIKALPKAPPATS